MDEKSTQKKVWFLRHGRTPFDYNNYDDFIEMLCNGHETRLIKNHEINFQSLPKQVEFVGYSPAKRSAETAKLLSKHLSVKGMEEVEILHEVKFDRDILRKHEFESLEQVRPVILERWRENKNKAESFEESLARVKGIEAFINARQEKTIILITHGWFLRLLALYFVEENLAPTVADLQRIRPVPFGQNIQVTFVGMPVNIFESIY